MLGLTAKRALVGAALALSLVAFDALAAKKDVAAATFHGVDGRNLVVGDYRGKWLLINYWATDCAPCVVEIPQLSRLASRDNRLRIIGVTDEDISPERLQAFLAVHPASFSIVQVQHGAVPRAFPASILGVRPRPMSYLIKPNGEVAKRIVGVVDVDDIERVIGSEAEAPASP